ncbi:MAG: LysM peptidoglycan-binding domain-containing protein [Anaerolineae bacterium]|nr:LysM peptidoglycan-binding domain-containing protein [Anaerolineae bacterium]
MRRFITIMLLVAIMLPFGMVVMGQDQPTPTPEQPELTEEAGIDPFELTATAIIDQVTQTAQALTPQQVENQGAAITATPVATQSTLGQGGGAAPQPTTAAPAPERFALGGGYGGYYAPPADGAVPPGYIQHYVHYGENLFRISLRYGVPIYAIQAANPWITNINLIYAGSVILIPVGAPPPTIVPPTQAPGGTVVHVVQRGEWLYMIARRYNTTVWAIVQANYIVNPNLIYPGQHLIIPVSGGSYPPPYTPGPGTPTVVPPTSAPPPQGSFELGGQVFGYANAADMRNAGMTWAKAQVTWSVGQDASIAQSAINDAHNEGFKVLLSIKGDPEEIRANPSQYYQDFAAFLGGVAALGPDAIEVWNEQNIDREWPNGLISPQAYTQMLSAAYQAIKAANSNVLVISGAPAPTGFFGGSCTGTGCDDQPFIQGMAAAGAANYMDCVGIHYNEGILPPTATSGDPRDNSSHYTRYYPSMVSVYSSAFPSRSLCFTELGYLTPEGYPPLPSAFSWASGTSVDEQSQWLAQAAQLSQQGGKVRIMIVWNVNATEYGDDPQAGYAIVRPGNTCPACVALNGVMNP